MSSEPEPPHSRKANRAASGRRVCAAVRSFPNPAPVFRNRRSANIILGCGAGIRILRYVVASRIAPHPPLFTGRVLFPAGSGARFRFTLFPGIIELTAAFASGLFALRLRRRTFRSAKCKRVCFCSRLFVSLTSSKILQLGKMQINLLLHSAYSYL